MTELGRFAIAMIAAVSLSGCDRTPDPGERVKEALDTQNIDDVKVNYDRDSKTVHLNGSVESAAEKQRAEQVAAKAVGTSGNVLNELTVEGSAENKADDFDAQIRGRLNEAMDKDVVLNGRDVNFDVNNGAVEIKGTVASAAEKNKVGEIVRGTQGVRDMANGLDVRPDEYANRKLPSVPNR